ncbi:tyrosine phosphatase family-domain-containing protein [Chaetomium sp. MPI-SDFR-AT-0129]|nr:tyrosine phosphatase family-domain-containing protein [Chaetomium sp. MPI-SDFR-AT-0129]
MDETRPLCSQPQGHFEPHKVQISPLQPLPSPPFIDVDGLYNFRDFGGYPLAGQVKKAVREGILYRSADPSKITARGLSELQQLRVSRIFDLRSTTEIGESVEKGWGKVWAWEEIPRVQTAVFTDADVTSGQRARRDRNLRNGSIEGFVEYYEQVLDAVTSPQNPYQPLKTILQHLVTPKPSRLEPTLIHCSLGKDRTGVICALILSLCGVENVVVAQEYALTTLGIQEKVAQIIQEIRPNGPGITKEEESFFSARKEAMQAFLERAGRNGGLERRVLESGILTAAQLQQLRNNLVVDVPPSDSIVE